MTARLLRLPLRSSQVTWTAAPVTLQRPPEQLDAAVYPSTRLRGVPFSVPEVGVGTGLGEAGLQVAKVSLAEHTVLEEAQLPEEHLRHLSQ